MQIVLRLPNLFSEKYFFDCTLLHTFAHMADKKVISVRPPKDSDIKYRLEIYAKKNERSSNYFAVKAIEIFLKKNKA